jgi:hypothetical protein
MRINFISAVNPRHITWEARYRGVRLVYNEMARGGTSWSDCALRRRTPETSHFDFLITFEIFLACRLGTKGTSRYVWYIFYATSLSEPCFALLV